MSISKFLIIIIPTTNQIKSDIIKESIYNQYIKKHANQSIKHNLNNLQIIQETEESLIENLSENELFLLNLHLNTTSKTINEIIINQNIIKSLISLLETNNLNENIFNYKIKIPENIRNIDLKSAKNNTIVDILNDIINFLKTYNELHKTLKIYKETTIIFKSEILFFDNLIENTTDDMFEKTLKFILNTDKIKDDICFNKNIKTKYLISISQNFDILEKLIYNYSEILLFLNLAKNIIKSNKKYTYSILLKNINKQTLKTLESNYKKIKTCDVFIIFIKNHKIYTKHIYKLQNQVIYPKIKITSNAILGLFFGLTFDLET